MKEASTPKSLGSTGGYLAMLLLAERTAVGTIPRPVIRGVATLCGIMDLAAQYDRELARSKLMTWSFLQSNPQKDPELFSAASPMARVHTAMPPVWMAHDSADLVVSVDQSRNMAEKLQEFGRSPIYLEARGINHKMLETTNCGKAIHPAQILFEQDFLRFVGRCLSLGPEDRDSFDADGKSTRPHVAIRRFRKNRRFTARIANPPCPESARVPS